MTSMILNPVSKFIKETLIEAKEKVDKSLALDKAQKSTGHVDRSRNKDNGGFEWHN